MASVANIVRFLPVAGTTADFVYLSAVTGYRSPTSSPALTDGATYRYRAESSDLSEWEIGEGTWTTATTTLARTTIIHSSTGAKVNFTVAPNVAIVALADQFVNPAGDTMTGALVVPNASGLKIKDTDASHTLGLVGGSNLTADRTLTLTTGDASRTLTLTADSSIGGAAYVSGGTDVAVADGGTGASTLAANAVLLGNGTSALQTVAPSTSGNVLTSNGTTWASAAPASKAADQQVFTSSGTWTKPSGFGAKATALIQCWGGGGGGGRSSTVNTATGGGGGGYSEQSLLLSTLGATETVTIGAGGAGRTGSTGNGTAGGATTFGTKVTASGGGGGGSATNAVGIGGSPLGTGETAANILPLMVGFNLATGTIVLSTPYQISHLHIGGHGKTSAADQNTANAVYGGGGGGGSGYSGGTSQNGGAGGNSAATPTAGAQPGGGGGGSSSANIDGASGAAGQCIVTVFDGA